MSAPFPISTFCLNNSTSLHGVILGLILHSAPLSRSADLTRSLGTHSGGAMKPQITSRYFSLISPLNIKKSVMRGRGSTPLVVDVAANAKKAAIKCNVGDAKQRHISNFIWAMQDASRRARSALCTPWKKKKDNSAQIAARFCCAFKKKRRGLCRFFFCVSVHYLERLFGSLRR